MSPFLPYLSTISYFPFFFTFFLHPAISFLPPPTSLYFLPCSHLRHLPPFHLFLLFPSFSSTPSIFFLFISSFYFLPFHPSISFLFISIFFNLPFHLLFLSSSFLSLPSFYYLLQVCFIIFYKSTAIENKIKKICDAFSANRYDLSNLNNSQELEKQQQDNHRELVDVSTYLHIFLVSYLCVFFYLNNFCIFFLILEMTSD